MSEGSNVPKRPIANRSWLHSEPARRAIKLSLTPRENLDNTRRNLETEYSSESESELPENVVTERDFPFNSFDESLFPNNTTDPTDDLQRETRRTRPFISRTPSRVSLRREFSLTSYESDQFDPEEIYNHLANMAEARFPPERTPANVPQSAVDAEIENMRRSIRQMGQNIAEADNTPPAYREERREINESSNEMREIMREMMQAMRQEMRQEIGNIRAEFCDIRNRETRQSRHNGDRTPPRERNDTAFEFTPDDVRHQRGRGFLSLKEAEMIPEFDGSTHKLQEFLSATTFIIIINFYKRTAYLNNKTYTLNYRVRDKTQERYSKLI